MLQQIFKGLARPNMKFHPFSTQHDVDGGCGDIFKTHKKLFSVCYGFRKWEKIPSVNILKHKKKQKTTRVGSNTAGRVHGHHREPPLYRHSFLL